MQINTKYFGPIDFSEGEALSFPNGLFGFEDEKEFLLLPFHGSQGTCCAFRAQKPRPWPLWP